MRSIDDPGKPDPLTSSNLTQTLCDFLACAVVVVNTDGKITALDSAAQELLGMSDASQSTQGLEQLPESLRNVIQATFSTGKAASQRPVLLERPGRMAINLRVGTIVTRAIRGKPAEVMTTLYYFKPAAKLEQRLQRLDRLASIGTLSAGSAHEIKNALVAVKSFVDLLMERNPDAELAGVVQREMERINSILKQMLKFAAPSSTAFSRTRVHEVLDHSLRLVHHQIEDKGIQLKRSFSALSDVVTGDDYQLEQAFVNLLLNALEAMGPHGELSISTELDAARGHHTDLSRDSVAQLRVLIKDSGVGIPAENMAFLFEPFFTTKQHGTGLGLPITRRIIQEHHGAISVESEPNKGATFSIILPALEQPPR